MPRPSAITLVTFLIAVLAWLKIRRLKKAPLPPGPAKFPLVGNLFNMPKTRAWETYARWGRELNSDVIHLDVAGTPIIVLNSVKAATELLDGRSAVYSDRPRATMVNELMGWDFMFGFMPYGDEWRAQRRLFTQEFHPAAAERFRPIEKRATHAFLCRLLDTPEDFYAHIRHLAGATILGIAYGLPVKDKDDPYITVAERGLKSLAHAAAPGAFLVDSIPWLKYVPPWFPGAGFQRKAKEWREYSRQMREMPWEAAKEMISQGTAVKSYTSYSLDAIAVDDNLTTPDECAREEFRVQSNAATMYTGGTDSTLSVVATYMLGMLSNPAAQVAAHAEIDDVLGDGELPDWNDRERLPYVEAVLKETMRWKNVTPLGIPHMTNQEDTYRGWRIPKGSIVMGNAWAMLHDPATYRNPFVFCPERFLGPNPAPDPSPLFGFGRRVCPGQYMATSAIWFTIVSMIAAFRIDKAVDADGNVIEPSYEYVDTLASIPLPFNCSITPRTCEVKAAIKLCSDGEEGY